MKNEMITIVESELFCTQVKSVWTEDEKDVFTTWLAANPEAGDKIPGSGGCHKIRWKRKGMGKSGGARVITFFRRQNGDIFLLAIYAKAVRGNIPAHILKQIKEEELL